MKEKEFKNCERCGGPLFPWERKSPICGGCTRLEIYKEEGLI